MILNRFLDYNNVMMDITSQKKKLLR